MQKIKLHLSALLLLCFACSCDKAGVAKLRLNGNENELPQELKGLKIYSVSTGDGSVKVAIFDNKANSTTYRVGKFEESLIVVDNSTSKQIKVSQILSETDSIIVCRK